ncbi:hypothetical protein GCM10009609_63230 [Pseudonocardia aurantiaca]|uniref:8-oxo-dGTP diphosphatase n=1 Tax=Pseudonocardia aurantiaca TaxID=75290 RepID=A0ABW4FS56_9PSEU
MPVLRSTVLIDAPPRTVAGLLRDSATAEEAIQWVGHRFAASSRLLRPGDEVRIGTRVVPGIRVPIRTRISAVSVDGMASVLVGGPLPELTHTMRLTPTPAGTLLLDEVRWRAPLGALGRVADVVLLRRLVLRMLAARSEVLVERAAEVLRQPVIVAAAVVRDGEVLAAQRTRPPDLAGRWELPGGRVESGESEPDAVARELREELGAEVAVQERLGTDLPLDGALLRVHIARLLPGGPEPRPLEHAALRWVGPAEVPEVDWVPADRAAAADLVALLRADPPARELDATG